MNLPSVKLQEREREETQGERGREGEDRERESAMDAKHRENREVERGIEKR